MHYDYFDTARLRSIARDMDSAMSRYSDARKKIEKIIDNMASYFSDPKSMLFTEKIEDLLCKLNKEEEAIRKYSDRLKNVAGTVERHVNNIRL